MVVVDGCRLLPSSHRYNQLSAFDLVETEKKTICILYRIRIFTTLEIVLYFFDVSHRHRLVFTMVEYTFGT